MGSSPSDPFSNPKFSCDVCFFTNVYAFSGISNLVSNVAFAPGHAFRPALHQSVIHAMRMPAYEYLKRHYLEAPGMSFAERSIKQFSFACVAELFTRSLLWPLRVASGEVTLVNRMWFLHVPIHGLRMLHYDILTARVKLPSFVTSECSKVVDAFILGAFCGSVAQAGSSVVGFPFYHMAQWLNHYSPFVDNEAVRTIPLLKRLSLPRPSAWNLIQSFPILVFGVTMGMYEALRVYSNLPTSYEEGLARRRF